MLAFAVEIYALKEMPNSDATIVVQMHYVANLPCGVQHEVVMACRAYHTVLPRLELVSFLRPQAVMVRG